MKKKTVLFLAIGLLLTGCGTEDALSRQAGSSRETEEMSEAETILDSVREETAEQEAGREESGEVKGAIKGEVKGKAEGEAVREAEEGSRETSLEERQYTWQEYTIILPEEWVGRCVMEEHESGFSIYQQASYKSNDRTGFVCGFFRTQEPVEYDHGKLIVAYTEDGTLYYLVQPTDVPCDTEDEKIAGEYIRMCQQVPQVKTSLQIAAPGVHGYADEYLFSTSSVFGLDPAMLEGLSDNTLWIAKNEIYARHGRQFSNSYLQQYFNRCTWYKGEIPPQEFQESALCETEKENLQILAAAEKVYDRQHPYPKKYQASETASEDLDGDGTADTVSYQVAEQENGEILCVLTVNGESCIVNDLSHFLSEQGMTNPTVGCFYITDILETDGILEIAVLDEGPSEDPVTYFFQYNGTLTYIGQIAGFPFADMNWGINGFNGYGGITAYSQADMLETAFVQNSCWYDGSRIVGLEQGWYDYLPSSAHELYEDLPVYCEMDETSAMTVIPAQEEVYFLGTDLRRWVLVKGKDGNQGYLLVEDGNVVGLNKPAEEVFSGLQFSG